MAIIEKAKIGETLDPRGAEPTAFGACERCGQNSNLTFKNNSFVCVTCL